MNTVEFEIVGWLERSHGSAEERASLAELRIRAGDACLTETHDRAAQSTRTTARLSLFHLADWLLWNYWRIRYEPAGIDDAGWALSHQIGGAGGGFLWPQLTLSCDGEAVTLSQRGDGPHRRMIRYLCSEDVQVPWADFDHAVDAFLTKVIDRLSAVGLRDNHITALRRIVFAERDEEAQAALRRDEARLGLDPDEIESELVLKLRQGAAWMGAEAVGEVFAQARFPQASASCQWLEQRSKSPDLTLDLTDLVPFTGESSRLNGNLPPWERGVRLAQHVRQQLGLAKKPLDLEYLVHTRIDCALTLEERPFAAGFPRGVSSRAVGVSLRRRNPAGRRFEVARILAESLFHATDRVLPVTDCTTARQKVQRAFAQELLSPLDGLRERVTLPHPSEREIDEAADHYCVSPWTVRSALVNGGLVSRSYLPPGS